MKGRKHIEMDERRKRQFTYLTLLLAAAFFAAIGQIGWWLAIAIAAGVAIDEIAYLIARRKAKPEDKNAAAGKKEELPEEAEEASGTPEEEDGKGPKQ